MPTLVIIWRKWWPFKVKTLQYQIINDHPSFVFCRNVYSNVQNDNIKKVFCPSCDILIKGHMIFFNPTKLLLRTKWRRFWIWIIICWKKFSVKAKFLNFHCNTIGVFVTLVIILNISELIWTYTILYYNLYVTIGTMLITM